MLQRLHIENIAVIERAELSLDEGFNVLTGETGAGKSIIIDALNAVLGERVSRELVRTGSDSAVVTALFADLSDAVAAGLAEIGCEPDEDGALLLERRIAADGKSVCRAGGRPVTAAMLRSAGRLLVNIHGQHENQALLHVERHVDYLDRLGGLLPVKEAYTALYRRYRDLRHELEAADMDEAMKARRMDLLRYQIEEIEQAELHAGEEEALLARRSLFRNAEKIARSIAGAHSMFYGDDDRAGVLAELSAAVSELQNAGRFMEPLAGLAGKAQELLYELEECAGDLRGYADELDVDAEERDQVEARLDLIHRLTAKYGADTGAVLAFLEQCREELAAIEHADERIARLTEETAQAEAAAQNAAVRLTEERRRAAETFTAAVMEELRFLDMPQVRLEVAIRPVSMRENGADEVEFLISANPGEPARSIAKIASGGELSRIMLAIQSVLADVDDIDTLVFDEVDAGISGRAALKVGVKLRQTATGLSGRRSRQVLCVTHLAQIAAQGHHHLLIEKSVRDGRTYTQVCPLDEAGREHELARIISGEVTAAGLEAAREMRRSYIQ